MKNSMTSYGQGTGPGKMSGGGRTTYSTGKTNRTSMPSVKVGYSTGKHDNQTNRKGDPGGAPANGRGK